MEYQNFNQINLNDPFFDSLKEDYAEFELWFNKKSCDGSKVYTSYDNNKALQGFLYLKEENTPIDDTVPTFPAKKRLKIGTFKINPHGTKWENVL